MLWKQVIFTKINYRTKQLSGSFSKFTGLGWKIGLPVKKMCKCISLQGFWGTFSSRSSWKVLEIEKIKIWFVSFVCHSSSRFTFFWLSYSHYSWSPTRFFTSNTFISNARLKFANFQNLGSYWELKSETFVKRFLSSQILFLTPFCQVGKANLGNFGFR